MTSDVSQHLESKRPEHRRTRNCLMAHPLLDVLLDHLVAAKTGVLIGVFSMNGPVRGLSYIGQAAVSCCNSCRLFDRWAY